MIYPETGDLWEYIPNGRVYLIMERTDDHYVDFNILCLDENEVFLYSFLEHGMDLWRKLA